MKPSIAILYVSLLLYCTCTVYRDSICESEVCHMTFSSKGFVLDGNFPDLSATGEVSKLTACCIKGNCFRHWENDVRLLSETTGCVNNEGAKITSGSCLCQEGYAPGEGFDCLMVDHCFCGSIKETEHYFHHAGMICTLTELQETLVCEGTCQHVPNVLTPIQKRRTDETVIEKPYVTIQEGSLLAYCGYKDCYVTIASQAGVKVLSFDKGNWIHAEHFCKQDADLCCAQVQFYWEGGAGNLSEECNVVVDPCGTHIPLFSMSSFRYFDCLSGWSKFLMIFTVCVSGTAILLLSTIIYNALCRCFPRIICLPLYIEPKSLCCCKGPKKAYSSLDESGEPEDDGNLMYTQNNSTGNEELLPSIEVEEHKINTEVLRETSNSTHRMIPQSQRDKDTTVALVPSTISLLGVQQVAKFLNNQSKQVTKPERGVIQYGTSDLTKVTIPNYLLLPILLALCTTGFCGCDRVNVLSDSYTSCTVVGSVKTCKMEVASAIQIPTVGNTGCVEYVDEHGDVVYKLSVKTNKVGYEIPQQIKYYTALNQIRSKVWSEYHMCLCGAFWTYSCKCERAQSSSPTCARGTTNPWVKTNDISHLSDHGKYWATMKCDIHGIEMHDIYTSWQLVPKGNSIPVYKLGDLRAYADVTVTAISKGETVSAKDLSIYQNSLYELANSTLVFNQVNPATVPSFGQKVVAKVGDQLIITTASEKNVPVLGSLGEIQASSPDFIKGWVPYTATPSFDTLTFQYNGSPHNPGLSVQYSEFKPVQEALVPGVYDGWSMYLSDGKIMAHKSGNSMVEFRLTYSGIVSVQVTKDVPSVTSFDYNCTKVIGDSSQTSMNYTCSSNTGYSPIECKKEGVFQIIDYLTCDGFAHMIPDIAIESCVDIKVGDISKVLTCTKKEVISLLNHTYVNSVHEPGGSPNSGNTAGLNFGDLFGGSMTWITGAIGGVLLLVILASIIIIVLKLGLPCVASCVSSKALKVGAASLLNSDANKIGLVELESGNDSILI